jgi:hypothetical protein
MLKNERPNSVLDFEKKLLTSSKVYFKSSLASDATAPEKSPNIAITTDSKYLYIHSEVEGLLKVGTGFNYTMLGKVKLVFFSTYFFFI